MYMFILWMCLAQSPTCDIAHSVHNMVLIYPADNMDDCKMQMLAAKSQPDPDGMVARYLCRPESEDL